MTLAAAAFDLRTAHHLANTARAHGNWCAWRFLVAEERRIRRLIATGQAYDRIDGGSPSHSDLPPAGDHGAPWARTRLASPSPSSMPAHERNDA